MRQVHLSGRYLAIILLISLLASGCTNGQTSSPGSGQTSTTIHTSSESMPGTPGGTTASRIGGNLAIAVLEQLPAFDPFGSSKQEPQLHPFEALTYQGLLTLADDQTLKPALASACQVEQASGKHIVQLTLRQGLQWSDGQPVTVEDVQYSLELYARPDYYGVWREQLHLITGASAYRSGQAEHLAGIALDPAKGVVRISLERDDIAFLQALRAPLLPKHQLTGKSVGEIDVLSQAGRIVGTGPFQIRQKEAKGWQYAANERYYAGMPKLAAVRVVPVAPADLYAKMSSGEVQWAWVTPEMASQLPTELSEQTELLKGPASGYQFLGFNVKSPALQDVAVRRALAQAIDPGMISKQQLYGLAETVDSPLAPQSFAHAAEAYPVYDVEQAKQVLAQKGYSEQKPLTLTLVYPTASEVRERLVKSLVAAWASLPVKIEQKGLAPEEYAAYVFGGKPLDLYLYGWKYPDDPAQLIKLWHSREKVGERGLNASRYESPHVDQLLQRAQQFLSADERKKLFAELQKQLSSDLPMDPLLQLPQYYLASKRLHGPAGHVSAQPFEQIHTWSLE